MMHRKDRLDMAIKSAKTHLEGEHDNIVTKKEILQNSSLVNPKSRLNKLTGKKLIDPPKSTSILQRLSNKQRPTFDLIANNVLGKGANKYRPKLDVSTNSDDISGLVAKRLANLRERTLKKVEDDVIMSESSFLVLNLMALQYGLVWSMIGNMMQQLQINMIQKNQIHTIILYKYLLW